MIRFFRNIRKKLAAENNVAKYLRYAIGEIVLVVIGILIALQINNYNNYSQEREIEQEYLLSLLTEFNTNLDRINIEIAVNEQRLNATNGLLTLFDNDVLDTISNKGMNKMFHPIFGAQMAYKPSTGVLKDMTSSGNLNLILNQKLRQHLASFESSLEFLKLQENEALSIKAKLAAILDKEGSVRNVVDELINFQHKSNSEKINNKLLFNSVEFENHLIDYLLTHRSASGPRFLGGLKKEIETILMEIEQELDK